MHILVCFFFSFTFPPMVDLSSDLMSLQSNLDCLMEPHHLLQYQLSKRSAACFNVLRSERMQDVNKQTIPVNRQIHLGNT